MIERQLSFTQDGRIRDNVQAAINILRMFEPAEGYYLAFSGGKDSQCVYHLAKEAGVKFDAHYSVTSVDPPELIRFIKENYPDVEISIPHDKDGKPITMWNLIPKKQLPPTPMARYCCEALKECNGKYRVILTGVRKAESINRKMNQGMVNIQSSNKKIRKIVDDSGVEYTTSKKGGVLLNYDNDEARNVVDMCYRTTKTLINPIIDWTEDEVWGYLDGNNIKHCCLYDEGFKRLGCIGCPMGRRKKMLSEFERWPKYKALYLKSFAKMLEVIKSKDKTATWETPEDVFEWWVRLN